MAAQTCRCDKLLKVSADWLEHVHCWACVLVLPVPGLNHFRHGLSLLSIGWNRSLGFLHQGEQLVHFVYGNQSRQQRITVPVGGTQSGADEEIFYRPQRSWGKVMFLHVSVILLTGRVCPSACWDTHPAGPDPPGADPPVPDTPRSRPPRRRPPRSRSPQAVQAGRYGNKRVVSMHTCLICRPKVWKANYSQTRVNKLLAIVSGSSMYKDHPYLLYIRQ